MKNVFMAPASITSDSKLPHIFLGGSIDNGKASDWRAIATEAIHESWDSNIVVLNPLRKTWTSNELPKQVQWELAAMERADFILFWIGEGSQAPITLVEIGLVAGQNYSGALNKVAVGCSLDFWRRGNLEIVCDRYRIPFVSSFENLLNISMPLLIRNHERRLTQLPS